MSQGLDVKKVEAALKRAAHRALHGSREERSGRLVSSLLADAKYDPQSRELDVRFVTGQRYRYSDVPSDVYDSLVKAESKGAFFNARVRKEYAYRKL
jgi:lysyl-tRNA synthetase class 2